MMPVPSLMVEVWAAAKARATAGSSMRASGGSGDGGAWGSGRTTCSPVHNESKPAASAAGASRAIASGDAPRPILMLNIPIFMNEE